MSRESRRVDISTATFLRALAVVASVWLWFRLWQWVLVFVIGAFLAIGLDPVVLRLEKHGIRRVHAAPALVLALVLALGVMVFVSGSALAEEARLLTARMQEAYEVAMSRLPPEIATQGLGLGGSSEQWTNAGRALVGGVVGLGVALVLAVYLLIDGRRTYKWLVAFVPGRHRDRVDEIARGAQQVIVAFVRGNLITSALAAIATWVVLAALGVPAAALLALLAGLLDLVPVIGFFLSAAPAVVLATAVSPGVALAVAAFYVLYNVFENYYIQPKVFGRELQLSDLAVVAAFLVGAELGGVLGAIVALPIAAVYPFVERAWVSGSRGQQVAEEHRRIESEPEH